MILYLMRHGPAEDRGPSGGDFDRRLTVPGRLVVARVAEELARVRGTPLPRFAASPLTRAQETARIVRERVAGAPSLIETHDALADHEPAWELARQLVRDAVDTLVVGHQPTIEVLVRGLLADAPEPLRLRRGFATATLVAIHFDAEGGGARLAHQLEPGLLETPSGATS